MFTTRFLRLDEEEYFANYTITGLDARAVKSPDKLDDYCYAITADRRLFKRARRLMKIRRSRSLEILEDPVFPDLTPSQLEYFGNDD